MSIKRILITSGISICLAVALILATGLIYAANLYQQAGPLQNDQITHIKRGSGVNVIANQLHREHIITHPLLFRIAAQLTGHHIKIKAGEYKIAARTPMKDVLEQLVSGDVYLRMITIPEGLTSWQIVERIKQANELPGDITDIPAEGSLLPETYSYTADDTKQSILKQMSDAMNETIDSLWENRAENLPIQTKEEAIILASIVEKETSVPSERKNVAGVFTNRLRKGIALQTDPTVIYALTNGKIQNDGQGPIGRRLLRKDLEVDSPYNTYRYAGLPPGPIANPGKAAIEAALNPATHEYYYFVADGTGGHAFAKTLQEHNQNVAQWRKIRKSQNK